MLHEFENEKGWVFILKKAIKVDVPERTRGEEWVKKLFKAKPGHEARMRSVDRAYFGK